MGRLGEGIGMWVGLGWVGLGWVGLGWVGWVGLGIKKVGVELYGKLHPQSEKLVV